MIQRIIFASLLLGLSVTAGYAAEHNDAQEAARLLAVLFDSGRVAVGKNQDLINDPAKGDKGFTPAVFEKQMLAIFEQRTGINLAAPNAGLPETAKPLIARLIEESKKTVASYQTVINIPGIKYKGLIPATFGTETASRFQSWSGIYLRQIAPERFLRNPKNKPDDYESAALKALAEQPAAANEAKPNAEVTDDGKTLRMMLPLYYGKACLECHGSPKGERDITGYPREGAKEGDLGGAISVKMPLK
jgi:general secretion pathway protein A